MKVDFTALPENARVWIYAAPKALTPEQQSLIQASADAFTESWSAHQVPLKAAFNIVHNQFLVFGVDVAHHDISGCGIDKSVHLVQQWERELGVDLFNRMQIELWVNQQVVTVNKTQLVAMVEAGQITAETQVFNKTTTDVGAFRTRFLIPLANSWVYPQLINATAKG